MSKRRWKYSIIIEKNQNENDNNDDELEREIGCYRIQAMVNNDESDIRYVRLNDGMNLNQIKQEAINTLEIENNTPLNNIYASYIINGQRRIQVKADAAIMNLFQDITSDQHILINFSLNVNEKENENRNNNNNNNNENNNNGHNNEQYSESEDSEPQREHISLININDNQNNLNNNRNNNNNNGNDRINKNSIIMSMSISLVFAALTIIGFVILVQLGQPSWWEFNLFGQNNKGVYCERVHSDQFLKERSNSISNISFALIGEIILFFGVYDLMLLKYHSAKKTSNLLLKYPIWSLFYGLSLIYLGIASFLYHASLKEIALIFDVAAIYAILLWFNLFFTFKFVCSHLNKYKLNGVIGFINIIFCNVLIILDILAFKYKTIFNLRPVFIRSVLIIISECVYFNLINWNNINRYNLCFGIIALILIVVGCGMREFESMFCDPDSIFQFHSLFHITIAVGLFFAYIMVRYETHSGKCKQEEIENIT